MRKIWGWVLTIFGGFFCAVGVLCIPMTFNEAGLSMAERALLLLVFAGFTVLNWKICRKGWKIAARTLVDSEEMDAID